MIKGEYPQYPYSSDGPVLPLDLLMHLSVCSREDVTFLAKWSIKDSISKGGLPLRQNTMQENVGHIVQYENNSASASG